MAILDEKDEITEQEYLILADLAYDNLSKTDSYNFLGKIYFPDGDLKTTYINEKGEEKAFLGTKRYKDEKVRIVNDGVPEILNSDLYMDVMKKWKVI